MDSPPRFPRRSVSSAWWPSDRCRNRSSAPCWWWRAESAPRLADRSSPPGSAASDTQPGAVWGGRNVGIGVIGSVRFQSLVRHARSKVRGRARAEVAHSQCSSQTSYTECLSSFLLCLWVSISRHFKAAWTIDTVMTLALFLTTKSCNWSCVIVNALLLYFFFPLVLISYFCPICLHCSFRTLGLPSVSSTIRYKIRQKYAMASKFRF